MRGDDIERWVVNSSRSWLINTPRGEVEIENFSAIRDWLLPYKSQLEKRATQQEWWELQQSQLKYQRSFLQGGIAFPDFSQGPKFVLLKEGSVIDCTVFYIDAGLTLLAFLNSKLVWFYLHGVSNPLRGGEWRLRLKSQYIETIPIPNFSTKSGKLAKLAVICSNAASCRARVDAAFSRRMLDLAPPHRRKLTQRLKNWHLLDFAAFRIAVRDAFSVEIPVRERADWETFLAESAERVRKLTSRIEMAEQRINAIVYHLFDLSAEEIALLEVSLV